MTRPVALTMPVVTVASSPKGLPMAMTGSPTSSVAESPKGITGRPVASIFTTARSVLGSPPTILPGQLPPVGELDLDLAGAVHDVVVGHDVPVGIDDEARPHVPRRAGGAAAPRRTAGTDRGPRCPGAAPRGAPARPPAVSLDRDVDHGGLELLADAHPVRGHGLRGRRHHRALRPQRSPRRLGEADVRRHGHDAGRHRHARHRPQPAPIAPTAGSRGRGLVPPLASALPFP